MQKHNRQRSVTVERDGGKTRDFFSSMRELFHLAVQYHQEGRMEEAAGIYERLLAIRPDNRDVLYNLGIVCHSLGKMDRAIACYCEALALDHNFAPAFFSLGNAYRDAGRPLDAINTYRHALARQPDHLDSLINLGTLYFHEGDLERAAACLEESLTLDDTHSQVHYNLGLVYHYRGEPERAVNAYSRAAELNPADSDARFNLGIVLTELDRLPEAVISYQEAITADPDDAEAHFNLGNALKNLHRLEEAARCFQRALEIEPGYGKAASNLGVVYHIMGRTDEALAAYRKAIDAGHDTPGNRHIINALTGRQTETAPIEYVIDLFDSYAPQFEQYLEGDLEYRVPAKLLDLLYNPPITGRRFENCLDLGCGTGLSGVPFRPYVDRLDGVDLSEAMLQQAEAKKIYDRLHREDFVSFLREGYTIYDLFIAADVLIYTGALNALFRAVAGRAGPGAWLLCSIETCEGHDYLLQQSGRYAHSSAYVKQAAGAAGFRLRKNLPCGIRLERGEWIPGELLAFQYRMHS